MLIKGCAGKPSYNWNVAIESQEAADNQWRLQELFQAKTHSGT